jgi:hypothetical protein
MHFKALRANYKVQTLTLKMHITSPKQNSISAVHTASQNASSSQKCKPHLKSGTIPQKCELYLKSAHYTLKVKNIP